MHRKSKVHKTHQLIKNSLMKFTGLIGAAISFRYLPFFLRHEFQPVTQKHVEIEKSP